jgi:NADPH2:quinone reductase
MRTREIYHSKSVTGITSSLSTKGEKVPVVFDGVGRTTWETSLNCLRSKGLMVSFGNASGPVTDVNLATLAQKGSLFVTRPITGLLT